MIFKHKIFKFFFLFFCNYFFCFVFREEHGDPLAKLMKDAPRGSRRNALLKWVANRTCAYKDVDVTNFRSVLVLI
jgi:hypothetical protein